MSDLTDALINIVNPPKPATLRASALKVGYLKSMLHMRHYLTAGGSDDTPGMRFGRLVHMAVLEPDKQPAIWTGGQRKGKAYEEWTAAQLPDIEQTTADEWASVTACAAAVMSNKRAAALLDGTKREYSLYADATQYGPVCARLDAWKPGVLIDLKSTQQVDRRSIERICTSMAYHIQFGTYSWILEALKLDRLPTCWGIFVEQKPPYDVAVYPISKFDVMAGMSEALKVAERYRICELRREWPGQQTDEEEIRLPEWAYKQAGGNLEDGNMGDL